jgi:acetyl-CoA carboxylase carboxyltransferase component
MLARERVDLLLDQDAPFLELSFLRRRQRGGPDSPEVA